MSNSPAGTSRSYSEVDHGTTVKVYLPRYLGQVSEASDAPPVVPVVKGNPGEIILVVEEELKVRQVSVDAQRELGYTVIQAAKPARLRSSSRFTPTSR